MKSHDEQEIDLLYFIAVFYKKKKSFLVIFIVFLSAVYLAYNFVTPLYRVQVTLLPTENTGGNMSALSGLLSLTGIGPAGNATQADKLLAIFSSRTLAERVILKNKNQIFQEFYPEKWRDGKWLDNDGKSTEPRIEDVARRLLDDSIKVSFELPIITFEITSTNADLAKRIADDYLVEAQNIINSSDLSIAERNRDFLEEQVKKIKMDVLLSKQSIMNYYSGAKVAISESGTVVDESILNLKKDGQKLSANVYLDYLEDMQDILKQTNLSLEKSYELAKVEAEREKLGFTVMDPAYVPLRPYFPNFVIFTILGVAGSLFFFLIYCFISLSWDLRKNNWAEMVKKS